MKLLAFFASFPPFTNVLAGLAAAGLCFQTALLLDWLFIPYWFYGLMFSSTFFVCALYRIIKKYSATHAGFTYKPATNGSAFLTGLTALAGCLSIYFCFNLNIKQFSWLSVVIILAIIFLTGLIPSRFSLWFYKHFTFRVLLLVTGLVLATTVIPASFIPYGYDARFWWLLSFRLLFTLAVFISPNRQATSQPSAQKGSFRTNYFVLVITGLSLVPGYITGVSPIYLALLFVSLAATAWLVNGTQRIFAHNNFLLPVVAFILQTLLICIPALFP